MRKPTPKEFDDLTAYLHLENLNDKDYREIVELAKEATIGVFDDYMSDSPGYAGRLMVVIWGYPELYELYQWDKQGMLARVIQDECLRQL